MLHFLCHLTDMLKAIKRYADHGAGKRWVRAGWLAYGAAKHLGVLLRPEVGADGSQGSLQVLNGASVEQRGRLAQLPSHSQGCYRLQRTRTLRCQPECPCKLAACLGFPAAKLLSACQARQACSCSGRPAACLWKDCRRLRATLLSYATTYSQ